MEPLTYYFDRNIGRRLPEALILLGLNVVHHHTPRQKLGLRATQVDQHLFSHEVEDDVWLRFVGERRWVVFSQDRKFHKAGYEHELSAIKQFNVACFYLWGANANVFEKARCFMRAYDRITQITKSRKGPYIYDVQRNGRLVEIAIP